MRNKAIVHDPRLQRFEYRLESHVSELSYLIRNQSLIIAHTYVPDALRGRGIASDLVEAAYCYAQQSQLKIEATCSYAAVWLQRKEREEEPSASLK